MQIFPIPSMKNWNQTEPEPDVYTTRTKQEPNFLKVLRTRTEPNPYLSDVCTEVSGVENIGQCGRLSQLSWLLGPL